jgi:hypothetical protein
MLCFFYIVEFSNKTQQRLMFFSEHAMESVHKELRGLAFNYVEPKNIPHTFNKEQRTF